MMNLPDSEADMIPADFEGVSEALKGKTEETCHVRNKGTLKGVMK